MPSLAPESAQKDAVPSAPVSTHRAPRVDLGALRDRRALMMLPVMALGASLPFVARAAEPLWIDASPVAQARFLARLCVSFLLLACFPAILFLVRIGATDVTGDQHRMILRAYPRLTTIWQSIVALDAFVLIAWPRLVSLPSFALDLAVSVLAAGLIPLILHHQTFFIGFDADALRRARDMLAQAPELSHARAPLDTLDYRVLQHVAKSGSDVTSVMINDMGVGFRDLMLRLSKLVALGYLHVAEEMHGPQVVLSTLATDTLALPVSLFTWDTDDRELLTELASARLSLEAREAQKVVVACARSCERLLRGELATVDPKVTHIGTKEVLKATLGDLVGACRQYKLIGRFEDGLFSAINERRKKIHALDGEEPINDQDAFVLYTLTEIVARDLLTRRGSRRAPSSPEASDVAPARGKAAAQESASA
jgi:hypothetical protein